MSERTITQSTHAQEALSLKPESALQRKCACGTHTIAGGECEECGRQRVQRRTAGRDEPEDVPQIVHEVLDAQGLPLDAETRAFMEPRFNHDFSHVRVHADARAAESARAVNALAYTVGRDIVFDAGQYAPGTSRGQQLMAHELAHVVQQSSLTRGALLRMGDAKSGAEGEADKVSDRIMRGENVRQGLFPQPLKLQRQASGTRRTTAPTPQQAPSSTQTQQSATQQPPPQASALSTATGIRVGRAGRFDAELDRRAALDPRRRAANEPCRLALTVKARFNFMDRRTPNRWTPAEQTRWQNEFIRAVTNRWSFRFMLAPQQTSCSSEPCRLAVAILHVVPVTSNAHHNINVFYEKPEGARSSVSVTGGNFYRSDIEQPGRDLRTNQTTAAHETGHLLGLAHVHCNTNDADCYGTNREESADIMGRGEIVTARDYVPFVTAIRQLTGCSWQVRDGQRGPLFGNTSTLLAITLGLAGGLIGGILGAAFGPLGIVLGAAGGAALGGLLGYGIGSLLD